MNFIPYLIPATIKGCEVADPIIRFNRRLWLGCMSELQARGGGGVDNPDARAAYEDAGFDWIVEAGLGAGPTEYLALRLHTFPATTTARKKWGDVGGHRNGPTPARG